MTKKSTKKEVDERIEAVENDSESVKIEHKKIEVVGATPTTSNPEWFLYSLSQNDYTPEITSEFISLYREARLEEREKAFHKSMAQLQSSLPVIKKTGHAEFETRNSGTMSYDFAKLEDIAEALKPLLEKFGFSYRWEQRQETNLITIDCIISHSAGYWIKTTMGAGADTSGNKNSIQQQASTVSYLRRYTLTGGFGITVSGEDNDAQEIENISGGNVSEEEFRTLYNDWSAKVSEGKRDSEDLITFYNNKGKQFTDFQLTEIRSWSPSTQGSN